MLAEECYGLSSAAFACRAVLCWRCAGNVRRAMLVLAITSILRGVLGPAGALGVIVSHRIALYHFGMPGLVSDPPCAGPLRPDMHISSSTSR